MSTTLAAHGSRLVTVDGIGPAVAARIVGRVGNPTRFPTTATFASYAGVAPIEVASGDRARHRLSRRGNRQLNARCTVVTQVRMPASAGRAYDDANRAAGKTHNEAVRCLQRRLRFTAPETVAITPDQYRQAVDLLASMILNYYLRDGREP